ncbi:conserved hypothetical protein [Thioalkalivibrio sulfidiphilus HL-EbGr7]|uniref:Glycosyltransferase n=1 Tax=Thioalkalivibrio sulfidiphilus (strain HL-EbGR7) TaxID=396588 RepID=B8GL54_THISH|nr:hypothetical protein [Thioalkalivibrio sulfidiphilus]ACL71572.1 conserved hypothetical protein [Thioalkalivibrio sulfidiphilus HL-EbGr7]
MLNFITLKWGDKYSADYVNKIYNMVSRNTTLPFRFYCLTDNPSGLSEHITPLPHVDVGLKGFWNKLLLFRRDFHGLRGTALYLDLDLVIVDNIDFLATHPGDFCICRNWSRRKMWNSSVMRFEFGAHPQIWEEFERNRESIMGRLNGDQEWIYECKPDATEWPSDKIISYKKSLNSKALPWLEKVGLGKLGEIGARYMTVRPTPDASIVVFHGKPDPEDVMEKSYGYWKRAPFVKAHWQ